MNKEKFIDYLDNFIKISSLDNSEITKPFLEFLIFNLGLIRGHVLQGDFDDE